MIWVLGYIASIVLANWALAEFGLVNVGFGLMAPAGVFFAGLTFTFRDLTHRQFGRWPTVLAVFAGAGISFFLEDAQKFAIASGVAFLVSELADLAVYEPMRKRGWLRAVAVSNVVGFVLDSALFLWLAFGSLDHIEGLLLGKAYMTGAAIAALWGWREWRRRRYQHQPWALGICAHPGMRQRAGLCRDCAAELGI